MKVLVVGNGAREHAIAWKLKQSPHVTRVFAAPGNAGTALVGENVSIGVEDIEGLIQFARGEDISLTVVGPERPLELGIANRFREKGLLIFGPTQAAAQIETNKHLAKQLMREADIPTAPWRYFNSFTRACDYLAKVAFPVVIKEIGLARGGGVLVTSDRKEAKLFLEARIEKIAKEGILFEQRLTGQEISVFAFVNGEKVSSLFVACDYKRLKDNDKGPNTGGMGAYSPPSMWTPQLDLQVRREIMEPIARALVARGTPFAGMLYAGLMLTSEGPKVLEFNARFGDPETQVLLPRLDSDLFEAMMLTIKGRIENISLQWKQESCVGVVLASQHYPGNSNIGLPHVVQGLTTCPPDVQVFYGGSGRILTVVARRPTLGEARGDVYAAIQNIYIPGAQYRTDIARVN